MNYIDELNDEQKEIVINGDGIIIIKAGPGTGKTKTLTSRVSYLLTEKKIKSENILTLTFTNRAAMEMRNRLQLLLKSKKNYLPTISTFHSFAFNILKQFRQDLKIISQQQQKEIIKNIIENNITSRKFYLLLTQYKNGLKIDLNQKIKNIIKKYNLELKQKHLVDFDDLILELFNLLKSEPTLLKKLQNQYRYILVDEFQDTNNLQYQILRLLIGINNNLFTIGDPNQSIYGFRGANPKVFEQIKIDFPSCKEILLTTNYRSRKQIINLSNKLFDINLYPGTNEDGEVKLISTLNEYSEAGWVNRFISNKIGGSDFIDAIESEKDISFSDFAIIFRTHRMAKYLAEKLDESGLPYQMVGKWSIYRESFIEFICFILKYINEDVEDNLHEIMNSSFIQTGNFYNIEELKQKIDSLKEQSKETLISLVEKIARTFSLINEENKINYNYFRGNLLQFNQVPNALHKFCDYYEKLQNSDFFDFLGDKITLLTMHSAKGLEFKYVFILGFEEGFIPYKNKKQDQLEEELRLLYVAITRAKVGLYLLETETRNRVKTNTSSFKKFLIGENLVEEQDEMLEKILIRKAKNKLKKSQMKLF